MLILEKCPGLQKVADSGEAPPDPQPHLTPAPVPRPPWEPGCTARLVITCMPLAVVSPSEALVWP